MLKNRKHEIDDITEEDIEKMIDGMKDQNMKRVVRFIYLSGVRMGEALALDPEDVDLEKRTISINKSYQFENLTGPKTKADYRTIELNDELMELVKEVLNEGKEHLFCDNKGNRMDGMKINEYMRKVSREITGKKIIAQYLYINKDGIRTYNALVNIKK